jgi:alpha-beta hydrolase superfamily lysophospholipase
MTSQLLTPEEEIYKLCSEIKDTSKLNIERQSDSEYVINQRNQKLHVHSYWPEENNLLGIIVSLHGMGCHSNRPMQKYMASEFCSNGFAYVCLDFHGHGYSEGVKGLVQSPEYLIDDVLSLLRALYPVSSSSMTDDTTPRKYKLNRQAGSTPFFLLGHSMGGSTAICVGQLLTDERMASITKGKRERNVSDYFRGCLLLCPAIDIKMPPAFVVAMLDYLVVPFFPLHPVPELFVARKSSDCLIWSNEAFQDYTARDGYPANPKGLCYGDPVRFQTASTLVKLAGQLKRTLSKVQFPFIVFHDPTEQIVLVQGSERLLEKSQTLAAHKSMVMVSDGLHDLISNSFSFITEKSIEWLKSQMSMTDPIYRTISLASCESEFTDRKNKDICLSHYLVHILLLAVIFIFTTFLSFQIVR